MIKSILNLRLEGNKERADAILQMLWNSPARDDFCFRTFQELADISGTLNARLGQGEGKYFEFRNRFTRFEMTVMEQLLSTDKWEAIKKRVHVKNEFTTRWLKAMTEQYDKTEKLRQDYVAALSNRGKVGLRDVDEHMRKRFVDFGDGRGSVHIVKG